MRRNNVVGSGDGNTPQDWYRALPILTKIILTSTLLSTAAVAFGLTTSYNFALLWPLVIKKFQIWRLVGCALYAGMFSFPYMFHVAMLYQYSLKYEQDPYNTGAYGTSADYLWMLIVGLMGIYAASLIFNLPYASTPFLFYILYVYSRRNHDGQTSFFGLKFKTLYVPWLNIGYKLIIGDDIMSPLIGIAIGHLFYFAVEILPTLHGITLIKTPHFCITAIEYMSGRSAPVPSVRAQGVPAAAAVNRSGYNWGSGRTLGGPRPHND